MYCHILRVRAIPTLESTDSMILPPHEYFSRADYIHHAAFTYIIFSYTTDPFSLSGSG